MEKGLNLVPEKGLDLVPEKDDPFLGRKNLRQPFLAYTESSRPGIEFRRLGLLDVYIAFACGVSHLIEFQVPLMYIHTYFFKTLYTIKASGLICIALKIH
jgi:hypothetical protein